MQTPVVENIYDKTLVVALSIDPDVSIEIEKRKENEALRLKQGNEAGEEQKLFAYGTGMRFNRVGGEWVVASHTRFGRAKLSGDIFLNQRLKDELIQIHTQG